MTSRIAEAGRLGLGAVAVALAFWLTPAGVFVVDWGRAGAHRVALLPDPRDLMWVMLAATAVAAVFVALADRTFAIRRHLAPLLLLLLVALPYVPVAADRFPLLLVFAGPLRWAIVAASAAGVLVSVARDRAWSVRAPSAAGIFLVSAIVYVIVGLHVTRTLGPGGDEPHYLIIAQSLLADGDLRIENNHEQRDYRAFFGGELRPDFLRRGRDRVIYSIHAPGLPALLLPAYALGGYPGAVVAVAVLTALTLVPLFLLARALAGAWPAAMAWLATAFTIPLAGHAWAIYPEVPAATVTSWAAWWIWSPQPSRVGVWLLRGAALALLPWLHTKFLALLVPLVACFVVKLRARPRAIASLLLPIAVSSIAWIWSFWMMYGVASPFIPYGAAEPEKLAWANVPRGVLGIFFDQEFGLLVHSPIYLLAVPGLWWLARERSTRWFSIAIVSTAVMFVLAVMRVYMWWGGTSAPARFLVPVLVLATPCLAVGFARARGAWKGVTVAALVASIGIWVLMAQPHLRLMPRNRSGVGAFVSYIEGQAPFTSALPSFLDVSWWNQLPSVVAMLVSLGGALAAARVMAKRWHSPHGPFWTGIAASIGTVAIFAVVGNAVIQPDRRADAVNRSRGTLMMTYDPPRLAAYDYPSGHWIAEDELWRLGRLVYPLDRFTSSRATLLPRPVALPAGRYQAAFWFNHRPPEATVTVLYSGRPPARLGDASGDRTNPAVVEFELPVTARGVEFAIQPAALADRLTRVELTPTGVVPRSRRPGASMPRSMFPIPGWAGGFVCFLDENSYPDAGMSWIRGGRSASILVVPAGATLVRVKLQAGAAPGPVSVVSSGQQTRVTLERNAHGDVYVPVPPGTHSLAIDVSSTSGFRPSDVNPQSGDRRYLGVRVGIELLR